MADAGEKQGADGGEGGCQEEHQLHLGAGSCSGLFMTLTIK